MPDADSGGGRRASRRIYLCGPQSTAKCPTRVSNRAICGSPDVPTGGLPGLLRCSLDGRQAFHDTGPSSQRGVRSAHAVPVRFRTDLTRFRVEER